MAADIGYKCWQIITQISRTNPHYTNNPNVTMTMYFMSIHSIHWALLTLSKAWKRLTDYKVSQTTSKQCSIAKRPVLPDSRTHAITLSNLVRISLYLDNNNHIKEELLWLKVSCFPVRCMSTTIKSMCMFYFGVWLSDLGTIWMCWGECFLFLFEIKGLL